MGYDYVEKQVVARKRHECAASGEFLRSGYGQVDIEPDDWLIVQAAKADKWEVKPNERCLVVSGFYEGRPFRYYKRIDMDNICIKYDLYEHYQ